MQVTTTAAASIFTAQLSNGGHVDVWVAGPSGQTDVLAQIFDASGQKVGTPVAVFSGGSVDGWTTGGVAALSESFVVTGSATMNTASSVPDARLYVQKVSASGELLASGGTSDPNVNGGLANEVLSEGQPLATAYVGGPIFPNGDFYTLSVVRIPSPRSGDDRQARLTFLVDPAGNVTSKPVLDSSVNSDYAVAPEITRLGNANYLVAGTSTLTYGPIVWKIIDEVDKGADHIFAQQSLGAAPGNSSSGAQVSALVNSNDGMLSFFSAISTGTSWKSFRISAFGEQKGVGPQLANATGNEHPKLTGLTNAGYVFTYYKDSNLVGQFYSASDQPVGGEFIIAFHVVADAPYSVLTTGDGFIAVYQISTNIGPQVFESRYTLPQ